MGSVYFIQEGEPKKKGAIKIGMSQNVEKRLETLQVGNSKNLFLVQEIKYYCWDFNYSLVLEGELHFEFRHQRLRGEWFFWNEKLERKIKQLAKEEQRIEEHISRSIENRRIFVLENEKFHREKERKERGFSSPNGDCKECGTKLSDNHYSKFLCPGCMEEKESE